MRTCFVHLRIFHYLKVFAKNVENTQKEFSPSERVCGSRYRHSCTHTLRQRSCGQTDNSNRRRVSSNSRIRGRKTLFGNFPRGTRKMLSTSSLSTRNHCDDIVRRSHTIMFAFASRFTFTFGCFAQLLLFVVTRFAHLPNLRILLFHFFFALNFSCYCAKVCAVHVIFHSIFFSNSTFSF